MTDTTSSNLMTLIDQTPCDDSCRELLEDLRWPTSVACPRCGNTDLCEIPDRHQWQCLGCDYQFSVTAGTIMHDSHLPLRKWFVASYLLLESRKGMSANQLKRTLGVSYKTAWYLCHRIRSAIGNDDMTGPTLFGIVEVDEALVGGQRRGVRSGNRPGKTWVAGAVQRGGKVRLERIPNIRKPTLHACIHQPPRQRRSRRHLRRRAVVLSGHRRPRREAPYSPTLGRRVGRQRCAHQQRRKRLEPVHALHRRCVP